MVGAEALLREQAVRHGVREGVHVTAGFPDLRVHDDSRIQAHHVFTLAGHGAPPGVAQVALELGSERTVVPEAADTAVDLARLVDEASALAETDELFHGGRVFLVGGHAGVWVERDREEATFRGKSKRLLFACSARQIRTVQ